MENIGKILQERRNELGLTLEEVSEKTRLTVKHIKAIEEGDITYFKDDLSYLRYFLKAYCNALGMNFDEVKGLLQDSIDDYTMSFSKNVMKEHEKMEANIHEASKKYHPEMKKKEKTKKPRKKIDFSLVSLLTIIIVALISVLLVFVMYILPDMRSDADENVPVDKPAVPEVQPEPEEEKPAKKPESELTLTADKNKIMIDEFKADKEITVEITFGENSWFEYRLNNVVMSEPVSKVYEGKTKLEVKITPKENDEMRFRLGRFKNASFKVDGKEVVLDETIAAVESVQDISFVFNKMKKEA